MSTPSGADRAKATRLHLQIKAGKTLMPDDAQWIRDYDKARAEVRESRGASARKVHTETHSVHTEEAAAVGTGDAASEAMIAAAMVKEEGKRIDNILDKALAIFDRSISALEKAAERSDSTADKLLARQEALERTHVTMLKTWHQTRLEVAELEAQKIISDAEAEGGDALSKLAAQLLPMLGPMLAAQGNGKKST